LIGAKKTKGFIRFLQRLIIIWTKELLRKSNKIISGKITQMSKYNSVYHRLTRILLWMILTALQNMQGELIFGYKRTSIEVV
jgi:hypothetical protein